MSDLNRKQEKLDKQISRDSMIAQMTHGLPPFQEWPKISRLNRDIVITEKIDGTNAAIGIVEEEVQVMPPSGGIDGPDFRDLGTFKTKTRVYAQSRTRIITPLNDNSGFAAWVERNADALAEHLGPGLHFGEWWGVGIQRGYGMSERRFSLFNTAKWGDKEEGRQALEALRAKGVAVYTVPVLYAGPWSGVFGYKNGETGEWLDMAAQADWEAADVAADIDVNIKAIMSELEYREDADLDCENIEKSIRALVPINPRPRFAPNFILEWLQRVGSQAAPGFMKPEGIVVFHRASGTCFKATIENDAKHKFEA